MCHSKEQVDKYKYKRKWYWLMKLKLYLQLNSLNNYLKSGDKVNEIKVF